MKSPSTARDRPPEEADEDTSFARGLRILLTVADRGEVRAEDLSVLLDTPTSTVYRYLRTLTAFGFVDRRDGRYLLGQRLVIGSGTNVTSEQLIRIADPVLRYLVAETGETAVVSRRIGLSAVCLHQVQSDQPLRVSIEPGSMSPLHAGALGRVLLAYAQPEIIEAVIARGLEQVTPATLSEAVLRETLAETRTTGIARSEGELVSDSVGIAAPIFRDGEIVGAIGIIGPEGRCGLAWRARVTHLLPDAARTIMSGLEDEAPPPTTPIE
jgi:IclR family transcriptional regulator, acetate operon repressor